MGTENRSLEIWFLVTLYPCRAQVLDSDRSGGLDSRELCEAMHKLVRVRACANIYSLENAQLLSAPRVSRAPNRA